MPVRYFNETLGSVAGPYFAIKRMKVDGVRITLEGFFISIEGELAVSCHSQAEAVQGAIHENRAHREARLLRVKRTKATAYRLMSAKAAGLVVERTDYRIDDEENEIASPPTLEVWVGSLVLPCATVALGDAELDRRKTPRSPGPGH
jgi:hypothetical protein